MTVTKEMVLLKALGLEIEGEEFRNAEEVAKVFREFKTVKALLDTHEKNVLKPFFFQQAETFGNLTENGGHKVELSDGTGWHKQARVSVKVDTDKALELMETKDLPQYIDTAETIPEENMEEVIKLLRAIPNMKNLVEPLIEKTKSVSETSLEQAFLRQEISDEDLGGIIERKTTYALVEIKAPKKKK